MRIKLGILCLALVVFDPLVGAFPSSGSNGIVNATILGTYRLDEQHIIVDILFPEDDPSFLCGILEGIALVDDDDKFYESNLEFNTQGVSVKYDNPSRYANSGCRGLYAFYGVPQSAVIEKVIIYPKSGDPFSIEWIPIPEASGIPLSMKLYGLESTIGVKESHDMFNITDELDDNHWTVDVELTNTCCYNLEINTDEFEISDQFGFTYPANRKDDPAKLQPGESLRMTIQFDRISKLSMPIYLTYTPSDLRIDISALAGSQYQTVDSCLKSQFAKV